MKCVKIDERQLSKIYSVSESMLNLKVTSEINENSFTKSTCKIVYWQKYELQIVFTIWIVCHCIYNFYPRPPFKADN